MAALEDMFDCRRDATAESASDQHNDNKRKAGKPARSSNKGQKAPRTDPPIVARGLTENLDSGGTGASADKAALDESSSEAADNSCTRDALCLSSDPSDLFDIKDNLEGSKSKAYGDSGSDDSDDDDEAGSSLASDHEGDGEDDDEGIDKECPDLDEEFVRFMTLCLMARSTLPIPSLAAPYPT
ncbi:uncharacterized protein PFL1_04108 [Pseudozyma flocculosa PF-1]|uniref:Uncharacterized protein n=2 Tax=Pseudozyma flocculosa TaxID=84751 RepID=A0A5C3EUN6_9BASI|nr:uncharacterized protein PFL1_04108 [Pseudozyma flocculosa PF-1]EPQ28281.1 hypothetical protein PFL1_04108 [Pseudozyma flocculosa PF-1]SPO35425.1 uncharacterized protein PSFLO_00896 [Pseudozyma flocculosa]